MSRTPRLILSVVLSASLLGCSDGRSDGKSVPGSRASLFLTSTPAALLVEVDYVEGRAPTPDALRLLEQRLRERCDKPAGVRVLLDDVLPATRQVHGLSSLRRLEKEHRDVRTTDAQASLYVIYADGGSQWDTRNTRILGWAYGGDAIVIFPEAIELTAQGSVEQLEGAALVHELGHVFGLVNQGTPMLTPHEDMRHPGHDIDEGCVMHYALEGPGVGGFLNSAPPTQFDDRCIDDMRAQGGR